MKTFQCKVVSVNKELYSGEAKALIADGKCGQLGILANHAPLITLLRAGTIKIRTVGSVDDEYIDILGGVLEVQPNLVTVLADTEVRARNPA